MKKENLHAERVNLRRHSRHTQSKYPINSCWSRSFSLSACLTLAPRRRGFASPTSPPPSAGSVATTTIRGQVDSPSFFNPVEAEKVAELIERLLAASKADGTGITTNDVAVVTPYRKQVVKVDTS